MNANPNKTGVVGFVAASRETRDRATLPSVRGTVPTLHRGPQLLHRQEQVVDHNVGMTETAIGYLVLLLPVARGTSRHWLHRRFTEKGSMRDVPVTLDTLQSVTHMRGMVDLMSGVLGPYVTYLVALLAGPRINFRAQNRAFVLAGDPFKHISGAIEMSLEFANDARLGMAVYAIGFCVDRPGVGRSLPGYIPSLHDLATAAKA